MKQALFILGLSLLLFFWPAILQQQVFFFGDNTTLFYPTKHLAAQELSQFRLPLWNPYIFSGTPILADAALGALSPFMIFHIFFPSELAISISIILGMLISGSGMYIFAKSLGLKSNPSLLVATIWMLSGSMLERTGNTTAIETLAFVPWYFAGISMALTSGKWQWILISAIAFALSIYSGYLPLVLIFTLVLFGFTYYQTKVTSRKFNKLWSPHVLIGMILTIGIGLASLQILPFIEHYSTSTRPDRVEDNISQSSLSLIELPRLALAQLYGSRNQGNSWGPGSPPEIGRAGTDGYLGIIPLIIIITSASFLWRKYRFWIVLSLTALIFSLGLTTPIGWINSQIPFLNSVRPQQWLVVYTFATSILAAVGFRHSIKNIKKHSKTILIPISIIFIISLFWLIPEIINSLLKTLTSILPAFYTPAKLQIILQTIANNISIVSGIILIFILSIKLFSSITKTHKYVGLITVLLIILDLFLLGRGSVFLADRSIYQYTHPIHQDLERLTGENYRFISWSGVVPFADLGPLYNQLWVREPFSESMMTSDQQNNISILNQKMTELEPNLAMPFGIPTVNGYAGLVNRDYAGFKNSKGLNRIDIDLEDITKLSATSTRYLLAKSNFNPPEGWNKKLSSQDLTIWENDQAFPLIYHEDNNLFMPLRFNHIHPGKITINLDGHDSGKVVINTNYNRGWRASIDGKPGSVLKSPGSYNMYVMLLDSTNSIELKYMPKSAYIGSTITILTLLFTSTILIPYLSHRKLINEVK